MSRVKCLRLYQFPSRTNKYADKFPREVAITEASLSANSNELPAFPSCLG
ncbi:hypothetical protein [Gimesia chilikensis]